MKIGDIFSRFLHLCSVPACISCGERLDFSDLAFCSECYDKFSSAKKQDCSRCAKLLPECTCTNEFLKTHFVKGLVKVFRYRPAEKENAPENMLIYAIKREERYDVIKRAVLELRLAMENSLDINEDVVFTSVPRRKSAILEYGVDHAAKIAKLLSKEFGAKYLPLLGSRAKKAQKTLTRIERLKNAEFVIRKDLDLSGKTAVLVDDVVTTGASMASAASLIRSLGCKKIYGACLGIAYRDSII